MRNAVLTSQKLSATLCFLVIGQAFEDLKLTNTTRPQTLSRIVLQPSKMSLKVKHKGNKVTCYQAEKIQYT